MSNVVNIVEGHKNKYDTEPILRLGLLHTLLIIAAATHAHACSRRVIVWSLLVALSYCALLVWWVSHAAMPASILVEVW